MTREYTMTMTATAPKTWKIDPTHSQVEFAAKHMMITTVKGSLTAMEGIIALDPSDAAASSAEVTFEAASITTRVADRDTHLKSGDFLDVEQFPTISFRSTAVEGAVDAAFKVVGDLTIKGVTKSVVLDVRFEGQGKDPWGGERVSFLATGTIDRRDFGLTWNAALETGGVLVSNEIKLTLDVQAVG